jgi:hypothetical protein
MRALYRSLLARLRPTEPLHLLNDVQAEHRFAYLLGLSLQRHRTGMSRRAVRVAMLGACALLLVFLWQMLPRH